MDGNINEAEIGCERVCNIVDMGLKIQLEERIINYQEGIGYQYDVFEWKSFPVRKMPFGFAISEDVQGKTRLRIDIDYKAKPAFLTPLMAWKMRPLVHDVFLGYKHFAETGEKRTSLKLLRSQYKQLSLQNMQRA